MTIDETTGRLTKAASCQVIGYGYSYSVTLSKDDSQVAAYDEDAKNFTSELADKL
jgi:hypothetical protein